MNENERTKLHEEVVGLIRGCGVEPMVAFEQLDEQGSVLQIEIIYECEMTLEILERLSRALGTRSIDLGCDLGTSSDRSHDTRLVVKNPTWRARPPWTLAHNLVRLWSEDDATCGLPDHETLKLAWVRIFGNKMPSTGEMVWDAGDATYRLFPPGRVAIVSYPGACEICVCK